ncbi:MAG: BREX system Lon protease-like protein BrxL [bacterium]|nr:BREX system Lon protease-like protein BrxL [bacterium]
MKELNHLDKKIKEIFPEESLLKIKENYSVFEGKNLPSFIKDWLVKKFSYEDGRIDVEEMRDYIDKHIPQKESAKRLKGSLMHDRTPIKILARALIEPDIKRGIFRFSIPDLGINFNEGKVPEYVVERNPELKGGEVWGIFELKYQEEEKENFIVIQDYQPFKPYEIDLEYYKEGRKEFGLEEWVDLLVRSMEYNPDGFHSLEQKLLFVSRLIVFVEPRVNLIELAPKGTGKTYIFNNISKYGWCVSGGKVTRAKMFYDMGRNVPGFITRYDFVAFDEVQTIEFSNDEEMRAALKSYLELGKFTVGNYHGESDAGFMLLGNVQLDRELKPLSMVYFNELPESFNESALFDRFHGFIEGWRLPRINEDLKISGYALNVEYFAEVLHNLRTRSEYATMVDELLNIPPKADTRDTTAIKRLATGYLKLLFPHVREVSEIDKDEFEIFCLRPAIEKRAIIRRQLHLMDAEYKEELPDIKVKR